MAQSHVAADLRGRSREELNTLVAELKEELFTLRFAAATGQLESHGRLREARTSPGFTPCSRSATWASSPTPTSRSKRTQP